MIPSLLIFVRFLLGVWYPQEEAALPAVANAPVVDVPVIDAPVVAAPEVDATVVDVGAVDDANCWYADETGMLTHLVSFLFWHMGDAYLMPPTQEEKEKGNILTKFDIEKVLKGGMRWIPDEPMECPDIAILVQEHPSHIWCIPDPSSVDQTFSPDKTYWDCQNKCEDGDECSGVHSDPWFKLVLRLAENPPKEGPLSELKLDISLTKYDEDDNETTMPKVILSFSEFLSSYGGVDDIYYYWKEKDLLDEIFCLLHLIYVKV